MAPHIFSLGEIKDDRVQNNRKIFPYSPILKNHNHLRNLRIDVKHFIVREWSALYLYLFVSGKIVG